MNMISKKHFGKLLIATSLSLTFAFTATSAIGQPATAHASASTTANSVIELGKQYLGVPYEFGAKTGDTNSFDCSSFTQYVFQQNGISIPRSSIEQSSAGTFVSKNELQAGDLVFSDTNQDGTINHVSIYIGNGQLLHTYKVGVGVTISSFSGSSWDRTYVTARRLLPSDGQSSQEQSESIDATPDTTSQSVEQSTNKRSTEKTSPTWGRTFD
jgi:hypothetical protein